MDPNRILVIKVRALGDTLLATPALRALRRGYPRARLVVVVSPAGAEVLAGNPDVDEVWVYDKRRLGLMGQVRFWRRLRQAKFDVALAWHASWRTAWLARVSGAPVRVIHNHSGANYFSTLPITAKKESKSAIERDLDVIRALGIKPAGLELTFPLGAKDLKAAREFLRRHRLAAGKFMLLHPGAGTAAKRWTQAAAVELLDGMRRAQPWVLLAGPDEQNFAQAISAQACTHPPVFCGSLKEAGALISLARGLVTTDSGPKHVAAAVGTKTLTLWTNEPEAEWHPYDPATHALVRSTGGTAADISPAAVAAAAESYFTTGQRGKRR